VTQIVGSYSNSLARKADGSVIEWGDPNSRVAQLPTASRRSVIQVGAGGFHGLAVVAAPVISRLTPVSGSTLGGTTITISSTDLAGTTQVKVGGVSATGIVATATSVKAVTAASTAGLKDVAVTTAGGTATRAAAFTSVVPLPALASVSPATGPASGGTAFTINGSNLNGATSVKVGGVAATALVISATSISGKTPIGATGARDVSVTTAGGTATKAGAFVYVASPTIASVSPSSGPLVGGTAITIAGANLAGAKVTIDGVAATIVSATAGSISAKTPAGTVGAKSVVVTTVGGVATKLNGFTYTSSFTGGMPVAGGDSGAPARGAGSEHALAGHRGGDAAGAAPAATDAEGDTQVIEAPMGVQRYLQVITIRSEGDVSCDTALAAGSSVVDATLQETVDPIDLDQNGEADLCQLRRGDLDLNGAVDQDDATLLMQLVGSDPVLGIGDLDGDGSIDNADIAVLLTNFA
jgi:hypothetical protein